MKKKITRIKKGKKNDSFSAKSLIYLSIIGVFIISLFLLRYIYSNSVLGTATAKNLLTNGNFQGFDGKKVPSWIFIQHKMGKATIISDSTTIDPANNLSSLKVTVTNATASTPWDVQLGQQGVPLLANHSYHLLFDAKADSVRNIEVAFQQMNAPYKVYYLQSVLVGPNNFGTAPTSVEFTMPSIFSNSSAALLANPNVVLWFNFGQTSGNVWLNNVHLTQLPNPHPLYFGMEFGNGMSQSDASKFLPAVTTEEAKVHHKMSIVTNYQGWGNPVIAPFMTQIDENMREHGSIPMITWGPRNAALPSNNQPTYNLESIINGSHDLYINQWAMAAKAWGHPFFLRFAHEMNGDWYPWSELTNGNQPGQYVKAWRHVHDIFTKDGVTNVTWVWCPALDKPGHTPLSELYPGNKYVDWTCMDAYNNSPTTWVDFYDTVEPTYKKILSLAPNKPMMIGENGSIENSTNPGAKPNWLTQGYTKDIPYAFPKIYAVLYYDVPSECPQCTIDTTQASLNAFIKAIQLPIYLSNTYSNLSSGIIEPDGQIQKNNQTPGKISRVTPNLLQYITGFFTSLMH